jgi:uncharacterized membrane protein YciS (DUF1049 family)
VDVSHRSNHVNLCVTIFLFSHYYFKVKVKVKKEKKKKKRNIYKYNPGYHFTKHVDSKLK